MRLHKYLKMYLHLYIYTWGTTQVALTILSLHERRDTCMPSHVPIIVSGP